MPRAAPPSSQPALLQSLRDVESTIPSWLCRPGFAITGVKCSQLSVSSFQQLLWLVGRIKKKKKGIYLLVEMCSSCGDGAAGFGILEAF